jgi:transposase-like protein
MAAAISPCTGRAYGVACVCDGFGVARSSFYAWRQQQERPTPPPSRRGPKPAISDTALSVPSEPCLNVMTHGEE